MHRLEQKLRTWFVPPSSGVHLDVADGLRGLAILMVVFGHGFFVNPSSSTAVLTIAKWVHSGWMGVRLFFVLSGFLIALPFFQKRQAEGQFGHIGGYALRRALKIFPPFYFMIIVLALYYYWHYRDTEYFKLGLQWASGVAHFVPLSKYFNLSFWSLWVEVGFYLVLPFLFLSMRTVAVRTAGWIMLVILMVVPAVTRTLTFPYGANGADILVYTSRFPNSLDFFAWGVWFASFYVSYSGTLDQRRRLARWGIVGLFSFIGCSLFLAFTPDWVAAGDLSPYWEEELQHYLPMFSGFLILFLVFDPDCWATRMFSVPWLRFLGVVSYEWFLIHQPVQFQFREMLPEGHGNLFRFALKFGLPLVLTLAAAVLLYKFFSLPILRWGRSQGRQLRSRTSPHLVTSK